ncbi:hypothetical protein M91_11706, partial [Bos mutus]
CICQVLHEKITILVTHQWQYLKDASQILLLEKGEMVQKGTYAELLKSGVDFASLLKKENEEAEPSPVPESPTIRTQTSSESSVQSQQSSTPLLKDAAAEDQDTENIQDTLSEERRLEGKVGFKTYKNYFRAGAHWSVIIFLILVNIAAQVAYILEDWWLLNWANEQHTLNITAHEKGNITEMLDLNWYLGIFSGLTVSTLIFGVTRSLLALYIFVNSSQTLHNKMLKTILRVPVLFFDRNPAGKSDTKFLSKYVLTQLVLCHVLTFLQVIGVVVVVVVVIPWIAIPVIPLGIIFLILRRYFLETSRDVKRLECSTRSPVFSHLASSLQGLWTIRAYKAEQRFQELFDSHQDLHSGLLGSESISWCLETSLFLRLPSRDGALSLPLLSLFFVFYIFSYLLSKTMGCFSGCLMFSAGIQKSAVQFSHSVMSDSLRTHESQHARPPCPSPTPRVHSNSCPLKNCILFLNFFFFLSKIPESNCSHCCLESVFSSFGVTLPEIALRCVIHRGPLTMSQQIWSHDVSLKKDQFAFTRITKLFKKMSFFFLYAQVQLKEIIEELPDKMDTELVESGSNLSVGQKQLVCLARAILRKNQILIIDEATAHVDPSTDELIQKKIREKFAQCTVLTIAHRLSTIIDSDRIMVLDSGKLEEYGEPCVLLQNRDGLFYKMVQQQGKAKAAALTETAKQILTEHRTPILQTFHIH